MRALKLILHILSNNSHVLKIFIKISRGFLNILLFLMVEYLSIGAAVLPKYHKFLTLSIFDEVLFYNIPLKYQWALQ
jgi:hypothetical protein